MYFWVLYLKKAIYRIDWPTRPREQLINHIDIDACIYIIGAAQSRNIGTCCWAFL